MYRRKSSIGLIVAAIVATIASFSGLEGKAADGRRIVIEIRQFKFTPNAPIVSPGDVIIWQNKDIVPHTVTATDKSWDSGKINAGGEWQMVIEGDLFERYFCRFHPAMKARLMVATE